MSAVRRKLFGTVILTEKRTACRIIPTNDKIALVVSMNYGAGDAF